MRSKEELNKLKEEINKANEKICELTPEELEQVAGGEAPSILTKLGLGAIRLPQGETYSSK